MNLQFVQFFGINLRAHLIFKCIFNSSRLYLNEEKFLPYKFQEKKTYHKEATTKIVLKKPHKKTLKKNNKYQDEIAQTY